MTATQSTMTSLTLVLCSFLVGCSGGDAESGVPGTGGGAGSGTSPPTASIELFSGYCTGTLISRKELMDPFSAGGWSSTGTYVEAGTTILMGMDGSSLDWAAYYFDAEGNPFRIHDVFDALVRGEDFTTECPNEPAWKTVDSVLMQSASLYADEELSGEPCIIPAGTVMSGYSYAYLGSKKASVSADQILEACGLQTAYSDDLMVEELIRNE